MTPEFIVNMLQEEFHIIIVLTFRSNEGQYFFQALFSQQHKLHL